MYFGRYFRGGHFDGGHFDAAAAVIVHRPSGPSGGGGGGGGGSSFFRMPYSALTAPPPHARPEDPFGVVMPDPAAPPPAAPVHVGRFAFEVAKRTAAQAAKLLAIETAIDYVEKKAHPSDKKAVRDAVRAKRDFDTVAAQIAMFRRWRGKEGP